MRVAVVLAGGSGQRTGIDANKVLVELAGVSVLRRSVDAMVAGGADAVIVVIRPEDRAAVSAVLGVVEHVLVDGGATRQQSEAAGILAAEALGAATPGDVIAVHDAARPLVSPRLVASVFEAASEGVAYPAVERHDLWHADIDGRPRTPAAGPMLAAQTPQGVRADLAIAAVRDGGEAAAGATDTVDVVCRFVPELRVTVIEGQATNLKVTWPDDFATAERVLAHAATDDDSSAQATTVESTLVQDGYSLDSDMVGDGPVVSDDYRTLSEVERQVADSQVALDCLAVEGTALCTTCQAAEADGTLVDRPALARCVAAKRA
jgi:2-C-methyl-D-erythritol 4-phosphate cytidylyltransferase